MELDPVVTEIPVYHSTALSRLLHVFCFPLRTSDRPYEVSKISLDVVEVASSQTPGAAAAAVPGHRGEFSVKQEPGLEDTSCSSINSAPDVSGSNAHFSMRMDFDCSGAMQPSFSGKETAVPPASFAHLSSQAANLRNNNNIGTSAAGMRLKQEVLDDDNGFGAVDTSDMRGSNHNSSDVYSYQLDSLPSQQHASYATALFYQGGLHLTRISGIHQFYPRTNIDLQLEAAMIHDLTSGGGGVGAGGTGGAAQAAAQAQQSLPLRMVPRSLFMSKEATRRVKIDFIGTDHPDTVPVAQLLVAPQSEAGGAPRAASAAAAAAAGVTNYDMRTAAQLQRSSSDPGRDEEEMMWGLQPFFPFIDGNSFDGTDSAANAAASRGGTNKGAVALKFAHHAMGIDEQVTTVLNMAKIANCADLQRTVLTPDRNTVPVARLVAALRRAAVCIHGVWAALWDPSCAGNASFVREYIMTKFALAPNGCVSARELMLPFEESNQIRKAVRIILPLFAELIEGKKEEQNGAENDNDDDDDANAAAAAPSSPVSSLSSSGRIWRLKHYSNGEHVRALARDCPDEAGAQAAAWRNRLEPVLANMRQIAAGDLIDKRQLVLRSVAIAATQQLRHAMASAGGAGQAAVLAAAELEKCRRFITNAFELHGVINKQLFKTRILDMQKTPSSVIFAAAKEALQEALKLEVRNFTDAAWILKSPADPSTAAVRPYVVAAMLEKRSFSTKEMVTKVVQLVQADPAQTLMPRAGTAAAAAAAAAVAAANNSDSDHGASDKPPQAKKEKEGATAALPQPSPEMKNAIMKVVNELAGFSRGEKVWHVKSGTVTFLAVA